MHCSSIDAARPMHGCVGGMTVTLLAPLMAMHGSKETTASIEHDDLVVLRRSPPFSSPLPESHTAQYHEVFRFTRDVITCQSRIQNARASIVASLLLVASSA